MRNVVELEQKKALLVDFAKGVPIGSTLEQVKNNTSETVQILKSQDRLPQQLSATEPSLPQWAAEPVASREPVFSPIIEVPPPVIIDKTSPTDKNRGGDFLSLSEKTTGKSQPQKEVIRENPEAESKPAKKEDKLSGNKTPAATRKRGRAGQKTRQKSEAVESRQREVVQESQTSPRPEQPAHNNESLNESRRNRGFLKAVVDIFRRSKKDEEKRDSNLASSLADQDDATETGMLGILGPIAPAIQETANLIESAKDEDGAIGKLLSKFGKNDQAAEHLEKTAQKDLSDMGYSRDKQGRIRDREGKFVSMGKKKEAARQKQFKDLAGPGLFSRRTEKEESPKALEKLDDIHDAIIDTDKEQKKRDRKALKAIGQIEGGDDGGFPFKPPRNLEKVAKVGLVGVAATAVTAGASLIAKDIYDIFKAYTQKDQSGKNKGVENVSGEDVAGVAGGLGGAAAGALAGATIGSAVPVVGTVIGGLIGAGIGAVGGNLIGGWLGKKTDEADPVEVAKEKQEAIDNANAMFPGMPAIPEKKVVKPAKQAQPSYFGFTHPALGMYSPPLQAEENRTPKHARDKKQKSEKDLQKKIDVSNKELIEEVRQTNTLLKQQLDQSKSKGQSRTAKTDDHIPSGIDNQSDLLAIFGLD